MYPVLPILPASSRLRVEWTKRVACHTKVQETFSLMLDGVRTLLATKLYGIIPERRDIETP
jgi:hypothetical protein